MRTAAQGNIGRYGRRPAGFANNQRTGIVNSRATYFQPGRQHNPICRLLELAWYFTGKEKYAAKAAVLVRHWFLDDSTRMNPNLNFAQAVPGVNDGRGIGIIETIALTGIADAALLLEGSRSWTGVDL